MRREIDWDGVQDPQSDPNNLPANFFNSTSPRGVEFSTPGAGFRVSANAGQATPSLFGFANEFQAFSAQKLFTAIGSNITDVRFSVPGTSTAATANAFGAIFVDVEPAGLALFAFALVGLVMAMRRGRVRARQRAALVQASRLSPYRRPFNGHATRAHF